MPLEEMKQLEMDWMQQNLRLGGGASEIAQSAGCL